jgi:hypothetical protein
MYELPAAFLSWATVNVTTLATTIFYIVDNSTGSTSTSVNTDNGVFTGTGSTVDYTPYATNAQGALVATVTVWDAELQQSPTTV